jgi:hypothetical protein
MVQATTRPNVPVFVSSTFTDMQGYRRKVQDALTQLEAIIRGMEQFGSKPGSPVEECVKVVQSCQLYVGVFGMRYGSVPDLKVCSRNEPHGWPEEGSPLVSVLLASLRRLRR